MRINFRKMKSGADPLVCGWPPGQPSGTTNIASKLAILSLVFISSATAQPTYELLLKGGHVIIEEILFDD